MNDVALLPSVTIKGGTPEQKTIAEMRFVSDTVGLVYEAQTSQLVKLANLVFDPHVAVISIQTESRFVRVESAGPATEVTEKFQEMVQYILGSSWTVQMCYNVNNANSKPRVKRNRSKPTRKKRVGASRKR